MQRLPSRLWLAALLACGSAMARECPLPTPLPAQLPALSGTPLLLGGPQGIEIHLGDGVDQLTHSNELLIVRYADGRNLAHRRLERSELGAEALDGQDLPGLVRTLFGAQAAENAQTRDWAESMRHSMGLCNGSTWHGKPGGVEVYGLSLEQSGTAFQAVYLLDGTYVHVLSIRGSQDFTQGLLASLKHRS
ncbi:MAG: hypothetical protein GAK43_01979 [Stenotrophomonas maltophilia]|nr:MAG: hypothetical protein GAK43_01979 [Stenotrophomonas maltophilia]